MMAAVRQKDTAPEMVVRRLLHSMGYRYRLHVPGLPGSPDLVFRSRMKVIFVHGCFWHGHKCGRGKLPKTRTEFWRVKIEGNRERDAKAVAELQRSGWQVCVVWQCEVDDGSNLRRRLVGFLDGREDVAV